MDYVILNVNGKDVAYDPYTNTIQKDFDYHNINPISCGRLPRKIGDTRYSLTFDELTWTIDNSKKHLLLSLTNSCNLNCAYCIYHDSRYVDRKLIYMSKDTVRNAISIFAETSMNNEVVAIGFYGGEPLLAFDTIQFAIKYAKKLMVGRQINFAITTNGMLLKDDIVDFLVENDVICTVSLDGPERVHDMYRVTQSGAPSYNTIMENISRMKKRYPDYFSSIIFNAVISPPHTLDNISEFFKNSKVNISYVEQTDAFKRTLQRKRIHTLQNSVIVDSDINVNSVYAQTFFEPLVKFHYASRYDGSSFFFQNGFCELLARKMFVSANGNIMPCEKVDESDDENIFGNVNDENPINTSKIQKALSFMEETVYKNCASCWAVWYCQTCYKEIKLIDVDGEKCLQRQKAIKRDFEMYLSLIQQEGWVEYFNNIKIY